MTTRTRLTFWYAGIMFVSLLAMGGLTYRQFAPEPHEQATHHAEADENDFRETLRIIVWCGVPAALLALGGGWFLMRRAFEPVTALTVAAEQVNESNLRRELPRSGNGDELDRLTEVFNGMLARLDDSFTRIHEFTLHASHELKTPLTVLRSQAETALSGDTLTPAQREFHAGHLEELRRLTRIVDSLTLLTKADAGLLPLQFAPVRLDELARESFSDAQILAHASGIQVELSACEALTVAGDEHRLRQLLLNLADNAIKYNQPQGHVKMTLHRAGESAEFTITNTGPGIPPEILPRVFDRFFRGDPAHSSAVDGCGLGLSIAQWIIFAHKGTIQISSMLSKYTNVTVRLPLWHPSRQARMRQLVILLAIVLMNGCARFHSQPLSPAEAASRLEARTLENPELRQFLETNLHHDLTNWPHPNWDFEMLTLAAFYYHPDLAVAHAQWGVARAGIKTAGGRPNPALSLVPGYDTTHSAVSPWFPAVSFDVPMETAGKRGKRIAAAQQLSESARLNIASVAWQVRSRLRTSLLDAAAARDRLRLLQEQVSAQEQIVRLLEQQAEAGAIARSELATFRIALQKIRLDLGDAARQMAEAQARVAEAIGVPITALADAVNSVNPLKNPPSETDLTSAEVRRAALTSRPDILGALAEYAATEAELRLQIAKQYPDVHLSPGYQFDQGDNKWSLGLTFDLPVLNQNQGPIAEARARREAAATKFNALQARVLAEIERTVEGFRVSGKNAALLQSLGETQAGHLASVEAQYRAGAVDQLEVLNARAESAGAALAQLDGQIKLQQALGALEDAVQRPLSNALLNAINDKAKAVSPRATAAKTGPEGTPPPSPPNAR